MKNMKYLLAICSLFALIYLMELVFFPSDYIKELKVIKTDVEFIKNITSTI